MSPLATLPTAGKSCCLVLPNGRLIHVSGIGDARSRTLDAWRNNAEAHARATIPSALPAAEERRIQATFEDQRQRLMNEDRAVVAQQAPGLDRIREKFQRTQLRLANDLIAVAQSGAPTRMNTDTLITEAYRKVAAEQSAVDEARRELDAMADLRFRKLHGPDIANGGLTNGMAVSQTTEDRQGLQPQPLAGEAWVRAGASPASG